MHQIIDLFYQDNVSILVGDGNSNYYFKPLIRNKQIEFYNNLGVAETNKYYLCIDLSILIPEDDVISKLYLDKNSYNIDLDEKIKNKNEEIKYLKKEIENAKKYLDKAEKEKKDILEKLEVFEKEYQNNEVSSINFLGISL
jgi:hypothetical protein